MWPLSLNPASFSSECIAALERFVEVKSLGRSQIDWK